MAVVVLPIWRVMHRLTPVGQGGLAVDRAYLTFSSPVASITPSSFRSAKTRRVLIVASPAGIAKTFEHVLYGLGGHGAVPPLIRHRHASRFTSVQSPGSPAAATP